MSVLERLTALLTYLIAMHLLTAVNIQKFASIRKLAALYLDNSTQCGRLVQMFVRLALRLRAPMQEYCLSRDDLDFVLSVTKFKGKEAWKEDPMASVETQTKAAFTRTFNKAEHKARCNLAVDDFKKKKGKGKSATEAPDDALGELLTQFVSLALWLSGQ